MKIFLTSLIFALLTNFLSGETIKAFTEDGREVALFDNGTWTYKPEKSRGADSKVEEAEIKIPQASKERLTNKRGKYSVWYNPEVWERMEGDEGGDIEFFLQMKDEDGYAMTIYERVPIPLSNLKKIAVVNMESAATGVKLTEEKMVNVNGKDIMFLQLECTIEGMPFIYRGYYASGKFGTLQFITYTHSSLIGEYKEEMDKLLAGLVIEDKE